MRFIGRHWAGEYPLARAYWLNAFFLASAVPAALIEVGNRYVQDVELRAGAFFVLVSLLLMLAAYLWGLVGAWRSARRHVGRGGKAGWALVAQLVLALGAAATAARYVQLGPFIREHVQIAVGADAIGTYEIKLLPGGTALYFEGALREGAGTALRDALAKAPQVRLLVLNSIGGRIGEGKRMAGLVQERGLSTYVEGECVSACTLVFLAGKDRAATPSARIGFHSGSLAGSASVAATRVMAARYREAGITQAFIDRVADTPAESMWYPGRAILVKEGVITRTSFGGETSLAGSHMSTREEAEALLGMQPAFAVMRQRYPDHYRQAVDALWQAKQAGLSDAEVLAAPRRVVATLITRLLPGMGDDAVREFGELSLQELKEAYSHGAEACLVFIGKRQGVPQTLLSQATVAREQALTERILAQSTGFTPRVPLARSAVQQAISAAAPHMPEHTLKHISDRTLWERNPDLYCKSLIAFYTGLLATPEPHGSTAIRGLFTATGS